MSPNPATPASTPLTCEMSEAGYRHMSPSKGTLFLTPHVDSWEPSRAYALSILPREKAQFGGATVAAVAQTSRIKQFRLIGASGQAF